MIKLGQGNEEAGREALAAWKGGMQIGGGITEENALEWLGAGAEKVFGFLFRCYKERLMVGPGDCDELSVPFSEVRAGPVEVSINQSG